LGTFRGKALIDSAAEHTGYGWVPAVLVLTSIVTGGALLRAAGRVFLGLGPAANPTATRPTTRCTTPRANGRVAATRSSPTASAWP
jgi:multicomponent Na+:H+ antiporter subunit D